MYLNYAPMAGLSVLFRLFGWLLGAVMDALPVRGHVQTACSPVVLQCGPAVSLCGSEYLLRVFILFNDKD